MENALQVLSQILGWTYFCAWSISFYPQILLNYQRKSVSGLSLDFLIANIIGFQCYAIYTVLMYSSPMLREAYKLKYQVETDNAIQLNDVVFAVHAAILTVVTGIQAVLYRNGEMRLSLTARILASVTLIAILLDVIITLLLTFIHSSQTGLYWLDCISRLSYVKWLASFLKYTPQVLLNYQRQSTVGWSLLNVLLDLTGGLLSIGQQVLDAYRLDDWTILVGTPVKWILGGTSLLYDTIFIVQHWIYANKKRSSTEQLLVEDEEEQTQQQL